MELKQKSKTETNGLIPPYGGELKNLIIKDNILKKDLISKATYDYCAANSGWVGVEDLIYDGGIAIYPNPTTGELNVVSSRIKNVLVTMYSVSGQIVVNETSESVIDISHLEDGVYFMNVKVGELTYIRKVIKQ